VADILITGFTQKYAKGPDGNLVTVDWVSWVPTHAPQTMGNSERVDRLNPDNIRLPEGSNGGEKIAYMRHIWAAVEPAYRAWKEGREVPLNGTPLAAWPGVTPEQAEVFRLTGIRSVEQVRDMTDGIRSKVRLPNTRELQELAKIFLENTGAAAAAEREAEKDRQIADMAERMAAMEALLAERIQDEETAPPADEEVVALRAELDAKGIKYHHKAGAAKLRELLQPEAA
jgi:hypothetical protein